MNCREISLKFKKFEDTDLIEVAAERIRLVRGVASIEPLFPEADDEKRNLYILKVFSEVVNQVLERLKKDPNVESAHEPVL